MQQIAKTIYILINIILMCIFFSSCNILSPQKNELRLLKKDEKILKNKKYNYFDDTQKSQGKLKKRNEPDASFFQSGANKKNVIDLVEKNKKNLKFNKNVFLNINQLSNSLNLKEKNLVHKIILIKKNSNFFRSALKSGIKTSEIHSIIKDIQSQVNFHKINAGSVFTLIFSHNLSNKKSVLLGVKLDNHKKKYYYIRSLKGNFFNINRYYKKEKIIDTSLLKKYRISSEFNLHRLHPITHRFNRHLGVDLAMPQGTPVLATINGKIIKTYYNKIAGFYITIKNENHILTKYMHLKKILVKPGDKVVIGQKIALSGNTGRTTGPHLHYEVWIDNHAVDPMNLVFHNLEKSNKNEKEIFLKKLKKILQCLR